MLASTLVRAGLPQSPESTAYRCFLSDLAGFTGSSLQDPTLTGMDGGERGIRTPGKFPYTRFPSVHLKPLGHLSNTSLFIKVAEEGGFEPPVREHAQ
jgi:hypothetical protein